MLYYLKMNMRLLLNILLLIAFLPFSAAAADDTTNIPISRRIFHDKIKDEQRLADKSDGRLDGVIKVSPNPDVNIQVTDSVPTGDAVPVVITVTDPVTGKSTKSNTVTIAVQ